MDIIFNEKVILKDIKRLTIEADKLRYVELKTDIFSDMTIIEICKKHEINTIKNMYSLKTKLNVCYFNHRCDEVNNIIHKPNMKNKVKYYPGLKIICRKRYMSKGMLLTVNYEYTIITVTPQIITIKDEVEDMTFKITNSILNDHFKLPYAVTCDSVQGMSFDEPITVFDSNLPYTDREFFWTAITRCRKLNDVSVFIHSEQEISRFTRSKIIQYFSFKIDGYKHQDFKKNRKWNDDEYITIDWIEERFTTMGTKCKYCSKHIQLYVDESACVHSDLTVDRIDNSKAHIKSNCQLCCLHCNNSKK